MFFGSTVIQSFLIIIAIFSVLFWILPRRFNWISFAVLTFLLSYLAFKIVPNISDDLFRYYNVINSLRAGGWNKMREFIENNLMDMGDYFTIRYLFWIVSRTQNNHWLQTIVIAFVYGSSSIMILLAQRRFDINKGYVYLGTLFFLSTYWYFDTASGIRNGLCFAIIVFCSYIMFVEKRFIPLCIIGYIIGFYTHSAGLLAIALVVVTAILYRIDSVFINFVFMFSLIGGNFLIQTFAENSNNSLLLSIAGRAEQHVGGDTIGTDINFIVNIVTVLTVIIIAIFLNYYLKDRTPSNDTSVFSKYVSLTMYFTVGSIFSGLIFMRFVRWIVPILGGLILMIGLQRQEERISEKGEIYYKYYAIPIERFLFNVKPILILMVFMYSVVHLWYDYSGSSLTFAHFGYEWEAMGIYDYTW